MRDDFLCPNCDHSIRATNVEFLFEDGESSDVIKSTFVAFSGYSHTDEKNQLYYCPNDDCRIERLLPGDSDE